MKHHQIFTGDRQRAVTYLAPELKDWVKAESKRHGVTESQMISKILEAAQFNSIKGTNENSRSFK